MQLDEQFYFKKILSVLFDHPEGLGKHRLRAIAFNRVNRAISDPWLADLERRRLIRSERTQKTFGAGPPMLKYMITKKGIRKCPLR